MSFAQSPLLLVVIGNSAMQLKKQLKLQPKLGLKVFPRLPQNFLRNFLIMFFLGGSAFVIGHYIFAPPKCIAQQRQTCSCPLW